MTTNEYIVNFTKDVSDLANTTDKLDGFLELIESETKIPIISIRSKKDKNDDTNETLLYKFITKNFAKVEFDDNELQFYLEYKDGYNQFQTYKSLINFDQNSSSAYKTFKDSFQKLINSKLETKFYSNGRIRYTGEVLELEDEDSLLNGNGTLYYNSENNEIKYTGEFEDDEFDGSGKFYSKDKNIYLIANNISNGIPNQKGKLIIKIKNKEEVFEVNFNELWKDFDLNGKKDIKSFVNKNNFVNEVAQYYWPVEDKCIDDICFENKTLEEQNLILLNEIRNLRFELLEMKNTMPKGYNQAFDNFSNSFKDLATLFLKDIFVNLVRAGEFFVALLVFFRFYFYLSLLKKN